MNKSPMIVPSVESESLRMFMSRYFSGKEVVKISYRPKNDMQAADCYENVKKYILKSKGEIAYGWSVWEWPGVMLEAFHHALWVRPDDGRLIDITPDDTNRFPYRLFISDQDAAFDDSMSRYENKRMPLNDDPLINEYIAACISFNKALENIHKGSFGHVVLTPEAEHLLEEKERIQAELTKKYR